MHELNPTDELIYLPNGIVILQNQFLSSTNLVIHATSTRCGGYSQGEFGTLNLGLSTGDNTDLVYQNRAKFFNALGIATERVIYAQQIHSNHTTTINEENLSLLMKSDMQRIPATDSMVTKLRNVPMAILTADCFPIFILDTLTPTIGLAHAGWRGTKKHMAMKTVRTMQKEFDTKPDHCFAWISAGIGVCCYQVGEEIRKEFMGEYGSKIDPIKEDNLDLAAINRYQLEMVGIPASSIFVSSYCTQHDSEWFYSYRRTGIRSGRMASIFMLK